MIGVSTLRLPSHHDDQSPAVMCHLGNFIPKDDFQKGNSAPTLSGLSWNPRGGAVKKNIDILPRMLSYKLLLGLGGWPSSIDLESGTR